jgi:F0F1-type ATP synthase alpha subunit
MGASEEIREGDSVKRTGLIASIKVGEGLLGRVVILLDNLSMVKVLLQVNYSRNAIRKKSSRCYLSSTSK